MLPMEILMDGFLQKRADGFRGAQSVPLRDPLQLRFDRRLDPGGDLHRLPLFGMVLSTRRVCIHWLRTRDGFACDRLWRGYAYAFGSMLILQYTQRGFLLTNC